MRVSMNPSWGERFEEVSCSMVAVTWGMDARVTAERSICSRMRFSASLRFSWVSGFSGSRARAARRWRSAASKSPCDRKARPAWIRLSAPIVPGAAAPRSRAGGAPPGAGGGGAGRAPAAQLDQLDAAELPLVEDQLAGLVLGGVGLLADL